MDAKEFEAYKIYALDDMHADSLDVGNRQFAKGLAETEHMTQGFTWYEPGAYGASHIHPHCEAIYYFSYAKGGGEGKVRLVMGWPFSKAEDVTLTGPVIVTIPKNCAHSFANVGDCGMYLLRIYAPAKTNELGLRDDLLDPHTNQYFDNQPDYAACTKPIYAAAKDFDEYIEYLKKLGIY